MSKEQEPLLSDEDLVAQLTKFGGRTLYEKDPIDAATVGGAAVIRDFYESARSKDTDLISFVKDWAEKRGHAFHCAITQHPVVGGVYHKGCTCGLSEVLQRINERSK